MAVRRSCRSVWDIRVAAVAFAWIYVASVFVRSTRAGLATVCTRRSIDAPLLRCSHRPGLRSKSVPIVVPSHSKIVRKAQARSSPSDGNDCWPPVTVQIVTYNRSALLRQALEQVTLQDYVGKVDVVVADDSEESALDIVKQYQGRINVTYMHLRDRRYSIGEKYNLVADAAVGEVICVWDDDDIFTLDRIRQQVSRMVCRRANCSSMGVRIVYSIEDMMVRRCVGMDYPLENTFCYRKDWLGSRRFYHKNFEYMEHLFNGSSNWYADAQPIQGEEVPFVYVRTLKPTASLVPGGREFTVRPFGESLFHSTSPGGKLEINAELLTLARAIWRHRFPSLEGHPGANVLAEVRRVLHKALANDVAIMRGVDQGPSVAAAYCQALHHPPPCEPIFHGGLSSGEAPEAPLGAVTAASIASVPAEVALDLIQEVVDAFGADS